MVKLLWKSRIVLFSCLWYNICIAVIILFYGLDDPLARLTFRQSMMPYTYRVHGIILNMPVFGVFCLIQQKIGGKF